MPVKHQQQTCAFVKKMIGQSIREKIVKAQVMYNVFTVSKKIMTLAQMASKFDFFAAEIGTFWSLKRFY